MQMVSPEKEEEILTAATRALNRAKLGLMTSADSAFFATVCLSVRHHFDFRIPTGCTNGTWIRINPSFFLTLTPGAQLSMLLHETMHIAYMHMLRTAGFDPAKFNQAADYVINGQMKDRGFEIPENWLYDSQYKDMSTEQVYKLLPDPPPPPPSSGGGGSSGDAVGGGIGSDLREPGDDGSGQTREEVANELNDILIRAAIQSKVAGDKPGSIPGEIGIFINKLLQPKLPWYRILQKYMSVFNKNDYSFRKPNRRFFPDHYLPSLYSESLEDIAIAVDSSGSVTDEEFKHFVTEVHSILRRFKPKQIHLLQFDARLRAVDIVEDSNALLRIKFTGRGGTQIKPVLKWARENKPKLLLVFSDGCFFQDHENVLKTPVVWLIHKNPDFKPSFGKVIHYDND